MNERHPDLFDEEAIDLRQACDIANRHGHVEPQVVLTHGEARSREPLADVLRKRMGLEPLLHGQGDMVKL